MQRTAIGWTDLSANPLKYRRPDGKVVWACVKCSPECANCYAESVGLRWRRAETFNAPNMRGLQPFMDPDELREIIRRKRCGGLQVDGARCFVGDMTDLFGDWVPFGLLDHLFAAMALRPQVTFQLLTKRPDRMAEYLQALQDAADLHAPHTKDGRFSPADVLRIRWMHANRLGGPASGWHGGGDVIQIGTPWPLPNVWLGTSVGNQQAADERIPHLLRCPAAVRFLSCEPLIGPVDLSRWMEPLQELMVCQACGEEFSDGEADRNGRHPYCGGQGDPNGDVGGSEIDWAIIGCESGNRRREMQERWAAEILDQCEAAGVAAYTKQVEVDGRVETDVDRFPERLRVRQFPEVAA